MDLGIRKHSLRLLFSANMRPRWPRPKLRWTPSYTWLHPQCFKLQHQLLIQEHKGLGLVRDDPKLLDDNGQEVGGSIPSYEISFLLDKKTCHVVYCLLCFGACLSTFSLKKQKQKKQKDYENSPQHFLHVCVILSTNSRLCSKDWCGNLNRSLILELE